jgi:hypothetical protein
MSRTPDDLISDYVERLDEELADLPRAGRREVLDEISAHIADMRAELPQENEAEIRRLLDRLGDPADIAAEARERFDVQPRRRSRLDVAALIFLSIGSLVIPILGWFVGLVLLWMSEVWSTRDKVLGTLLVPGGLGTPFLLVQTVGFSESCVQTHDERGRFIGQTCSGGPSSFDRVFWSALLIGLVVASIATTIFLAQRLRRTRLAVA